jgi:queuine/archaeosine tRNA-ribosyltransferase
VVVTLKFQKEIRSDIMAAEDEYVKPQYCLSCSAKHSRDLEHHLEDLETGSKENPELRQQAREMIDQIRDVRKRIDDLRIESLARKKLEEGGI